MNLEPWRNYSYYAWQSLGLWFYMSIFGPFLILWLCKSQNTTSLLLKICRETRTCFQWFLISGKLGFSFREKPVSAKINVTWHVTVVTAKTTLWTPLTETRHTEVEYFAWKEFISGVVSKVAAVSYRENRRKLFFRIYWLSWVMHFRHVNPLVWSSVAQ